MLETTFKAATRMTRATVAKMTTFSRRSAKESGALRSRHVRTRYPARVGRRPSAPRPRPAPDRRAGPRRPARRSRGPTAAARRLRERPPRGAFSSAPRREMSATAKADGNRDRADRREPRARRGQADAPRPTPAPMRKATGAATRAGGLFEAASPPAGFPPRRCGSARASPRRRETGGQPSSPLDDGRDGDDAGRAASAARTPLRVGERGSPFGRRRSGAASAPPSGRGCGPGSRKGATSEMTSAATPIASPRIENAEIRATCAVLRDAAR